jgi:hypothetical protein
MEVINLAPSAGFSPQRRGRRRNPTVASGPTPLRIWQNFPHGDLTRFPERGIGSGKWVEEVFESMIHESKVAEESEAACKSLMGHQTFLATHQAVGSPREEDPVGVRPGRVFSFSTMEPPTASCWGGGRRSADGETLRSKSNRRYEVLRPGLIHAVGLKDAYPMR